MRKSSIIIYGAAALAASVLFASCRESNYQDIRVDSRRLYESSVSLLKSYTDSLQHAGDSTEVMTLDKTLDDKITKVNAEYSPEAALRISEGENDTLTMMTMRFVALRDSLLLRFSKPLPSDSTQQDAD